MRSKKLSLAAVQICAVILTAVTCALPATAQVQPTNEFLTELGRKGLVFDAALFRDYTVVRVLPNPHFDYSFAVRHRTLPLEIRFATRSLGPSGQVSRASLRDSYASTSVMNMASQDRGEPMMQGPQPFDERAVKQEFNADWGATSKIVPAPTFAKYESGLVNIIYQERSQSFGYMIYLFNGELTGDMENAFGQVFHALRFK